MSANALLRIAMGSGDSATMGLGLLTPAAAFAASQPDVAVDWVVQQDWGGGFQVKVEVTNNTSATIDPWSVDFDYEPKVSSLWDALRQDTPDGFRVTAPAWGSALAPGATTSFGLIGSALPSEAKVPYTCEVAGLSCAVNDGAIQDSNDPVDPVDPADPTDPTDPVNPNDPVIAVEVAKHTRT
jgi:hypothetical protein